MEVMIGIDPHKRSHTAAMLDRRQRELRQITVRAGRRQVTELLAWADGVQTADVGGGVRRRDGLSVRPSSSSPPARRCSMCRRRWRHGCACWARVSR